MFYTVHLIVFSIVYTFSKVFRRSGGEGNSVNLIFISHRLLYSPELLSVAINPTDLVIYSQAYDLIYTIISHTAYLSFYFYVITTFCNDL